jgi:selenide,water dikinase
VELGQVLGSLPLLQDPNVLVGAGSRDDAAVYRIADDRALVATVDFFTPIVDDPRAFGAIAATNSVSDVYAMGGKPLFALSILAWPRGLLDNGMLEQIVAGGAAKLVEAGAPVVGGHSIDDAEPKFGYAVVGEVDPRRLITNEGAQSGDVLYLTKPLCSGLVATAIKSGQCPEALIESATAVMTHLNRQAAEAMVAAGAHAGTDVTGYGLIGHLINLKVGAEIELSRVPVLEGVRELAARDLFPGGTRRNHEALAGLVQWDGLGLEDQLLLCDAQTSGGLLVALPEERAAEFERLLEGSPWPVARIGRVTDDGSIRARA